MTISEMLETKMFRGNKSFLARELGVNRTTLFIYFQDKEGENHFVKETKGKIELFTNQSKKVTQIYQ